MTQLFQETFESGTNGNAVTTGSVIAKISGTGSSTYTTTAAKGTLGVNVTGSSNFRIHEIDHTSVSDVWYVFYWRCPSSSPSSNTTIANWYTSTSGTLVGNVRWDTSGVLALRDANFTTLGSTYSVSADTWYRIAVRVRPNRSTDGHIMKVYVGDSGTPAHTAQGNATQAGQTAVANFRFGQFVATTSTSLFDHITGDDTTEWTPTVGPQTLAPASDITTTGWTAYGTGASFAARLADSDDATYVESPSNPSSSPVEVKLGSGVDPGSDLGHSFLVRAKAPNSASSTLVCGLHQGATLIHSQTFTNVSASVWTDLSVAVPSTSATNITDYTDLRIRVTATAA